MWMTPNAARVCSKGSIPLSRLETYGGNLTKNLGIELPLVYPTAVLPPGLRGAETYSLDRVVGLAEFSKPAKPGASRPAHATEPRHNARPRGVTAYSTSAGLVGRTVRRTSAISGRVRVGKLDVDKNQATAARFAGAQGGLGDRPDRGGSVQVGDRARSGTSRGLR
jgi:hypothetical protein